ncbi:hypothetical protein V5O48_007245 [Marasmius crinis-equi]|uniref:BTB domain-containing protein n=1 Tax=Marasmius crinis-equi TaxID=585013 RepID=A0ABR3FHA6_9AGAR
MRTILIRVSAVIDSFGPLLAIWNHERNTDVAEDKRVRILGHEDKVLHKTLASFMTAKSQYTIDIPTLDATRYDSQVVDTVIEMAYTITTLDVVIEKFIRPFNGCSTTALKPLESLMRLLRDWDFEALLAVVECGVVSEGILSPSSSPAIREFLLSIADDLQLRILKSSCVLFEHTTEECIWYIDSFGQFRVVDSDGLVFADYTLHSVVYI